MGVGGVGSSGVGAGSSYTKAGAGVPTFSTSGGMSGARRHGRQYMGTVPFLSFYVQCT